MGGLPDNIGPYRVDRLLAEGGMGSVYLARRPAEDGIELPCVIKTIRAAHAGKADYEAMFRREARILASLHHQNIVRVLDYNRDGELLYLALEYVDGCDLAAVIERAGRSGDRAPLPIVLRIMAETLRGLAYAHRRTDEQGRNLGIVHRDLTPNNILVSREGEVKIVDFGLAKAQEVDGPSQVRQLKGKLHYLPPEHIDERPVDRRSDLYSLGIVLYELLTGQKPFQADSPTRVIASIVRGDYPPPSRLAPVPPALDAVVARAMAKDPAQRFDSADEMLAAIERLQGDFPAVSTEAFRAFCCQAATPSPPGVRAAAEERYKGTTAAVEVVAAPSEEAAAPRMARRSTGRRLALAAALGLAVAVALGFALWPRPAAEPLGPAPAAVTPEESAPAVALPESEPSPPTTAEERKPAATPAPTPQPTPTPTPTPTPKPQPTPPPVVAATPDPAPAAAEPGFLVVVDLNPYAEVHVNGQYKDLSPMKPLALPPGKYVVKLVNPKVAKVGYRNIEIVSGKTVTITKWPE